jgi:chaperone required for assembly of F1-ATPase
MRDIFEDIFTVEPSDPTEAARRAMRPRLRRRFYETASVGESAGGFAILLDDRPVKTPAHHALAAPNAAFAQAIAGEWAAQTEFVNPAKMPLTRLANSIVDGVATARADVKAEIEKYLGSDLLFYRAQTPDTLVARQAQLWDPVLAWAGETLGACFVLTEGVTFVAQPEASLAAAATAIPSDAWRLGALHAVTTITGSALIAFALAAGFLTLDQAWAAAHADEDWQMEQWGRDEIALASRAFRLSDMQAAATVLALSH